MCAIFGSRYIKVVYITAVFQMGERPVPGTPYFPVGSPILYDGRPGRPAWLHPELFADFEYLYPLLRYKALKFDEIHPKLSDVEFQC